MTQHHNTRKTDPCQTALFPPNRRRHAQPKQYFPPLVQWYFLQLSFFVPTFRAEIMGQLVSLAVTGTSPEEDVRDGGTTSTRSLTPKLREDVSTRTVPTSRHAQGDQEPEVPPSEDQYPLSGVHATEGGRGESRNDVHESAGVDRFA